MKKLVSVIVLLCLVLLVFGSVTYAKPKDKDKKPKKDKVIIIKHKGPKGKIIIVPGGGRGPDYPLERKAVNLTVYGGLTSSIAHAKPSGGEWYTRDGGMRYGIGTSLGIFLNRHVEMELGYTYHANEAVVEPPWTGPKGNVCSYPLYLNFVFHPRTWRFAHMYFGGGINYSFWSFHAKDNSYVFSPSGGLGFQLVNGIDTRFTRWEWGIMWTNGSFSSSGLNYDISLDGFYFKGGYKII